MITLEQIKDYVIQNGFGRSLRWMPDWYWSKGICYAFDEDEETWLPYIQKALAKVGTEDYGGFYGYDEEPIKGHEYWICESPFGKDINTGIIMHREYGTLVMYFQFER